MFLKCKCLHMFLNRFRYFGTVPFMVRFVPDCFIKNNLKIIKLFSLVSVDKQALINFQAKKLQEVGKTNHSEYLHAAHLHDKR